VPGTLSRVAIRSGVGNVAFVFCTRLERSDSFSSRPVDEEVTKTRRETNLGRRWKGGMGMKCIRRSIIFFTQRVSVNCERTGWRGFHVADITGMAM